jgi:protein involved in polysaccharide export with SLBB domain
VKTVLVWSIIALLSAAPAAAAPANGRAAPSEQPPYKLGAADKIRVTIFNEPSLSGEFLVNADGSLALPLIGNVQAAGLSAPEVQAALEARYAEGLLNTPRVGVEVLTYRPFYIYGQVVKPGEYPYSQNLTVLKAVALAQGFTARANKGKIYVKSAGAVERRATVDQIIQPSDLIRVPGRNF